MGFRFLIIGATLLAVILVAGALFTAWRTAQTQQQSPPLGEYSRQAQAHLHYRVAGSRDSNTPSLILLHGASTNLNDFYALLEALPAYLHVVSVDRPGAGYSTQVGTGWLNPSDQAKAIVGLQQSLDIPRAIWVGHSWAGSLVMSALKDYPEQVIGGVMLAGAAYSWEGGVDVIDHLPAVPILGPMIVHSLITPAGAMKFDAGIAQAFAPNLVTPEYRRRSAMDLYLRPAQFTATARDVANLSVYLDSRSDDYLNISQPVLLIHGDADTIVPAWNHADRLIEVLPNATYHTLEGTGHQPHHVHPEQIAAWILQFLGRHGFVSEVDAGPQESAP